MLNNLQRKSIRLKRYDYSQEGAYFITICTNNHKSLFGNIINDQINLNLIGKMINLHWKQLPNRFSHIQLDEHIVMPNHLHGIIILNDSPNTIPNVGAPLVGARNYSSTIGNIIGAFKSITTNEYVKNIKNNNWLPFQKKFWQRDYYEHIIRDEESLNILREYIIYNPVNWEKDELFIK